MLPWARYLYYCDAMTTVSIRYQKQTPSVTSTAAFSFHDTALQQLRRQSQLLLLPYPLETIIPTRLQQRHIPAESYICHPFEGWYSTTW